MQAQLNQAGGALGGYSTAFFSTQTSLHDKHDWVRGVCRAETEAVFLTEYPWAVNRLGPGLGSRRLA